MIRTAQQLVLPDIYEKSYGNLLLDRPIFADHTAISDFGTDLARLFDLLVALPDRMFGGDRRAYCRALGIDDRLAELLCPDGDDAGLPVHGRADAYHDGTRFRLLEFNIGSELGGTDAAQMNRAYLDVPSFAGFAARHGLAHVDTAGRVARALRAESVAVTGVAEPVVALIESTGGLAGHPHVFAALQEAMAGHGIDLLLGEITELTVRNGQVLLAGREIDLVLRYFVAAELVDDPAGQDVLAALTRAHRDGRTALFTSLRAGMSASKNALALLHDPQARGTFSAAEADLVDRVVPWTRRLGPAGSATTGSDTTGSAATVALIERCRADQAELVLKPGFGYGGVGTRVGLDLSPDQWRRALESSLGGDHVVQQRVHPAPEPVVDPETGSVHDWVANWGIFVDPEGYAGGFVRALRPEAGSVISYANPGTRGTCIFTAPQPAVP